VCVLMCGRLNNVLKKVAYSGVAVYEIPSHVEGHSVMHLASKRNEPHSVYGALKGFFCKWHRCTMRQNPLEVASRESVSE
jgi:hypothetical protein